YPIGVWDLRRPVVHFGQVATAPAGVPRRSTLVPTSFGQGLSHLRTDLQSPKRCWTDLQSTPPLETLPRKPAGPSFRDRLRTLPGPAFSRVPPFWPPICCHTLITEVRIASGPPDLSKTRA